MTVKIQRLVSRVHDLEFYITGSEEEALILENNLIKRYHPRFNVSLRDDKSFPFLKISLNEEWPRVYVTRKYEEDGSRYFGPFTSARSVRQTLKILKGIFPFRTCSRAINGKDRRPCLDYHIHNCLAPCMGDASKKEYDEVVRQVILFLEGKQERIVRSLERKMLKSSELLDYEGAALLRDQIQAIDRVIKGQKIAASVKGDQDAIAFASERDRACVHVYFIRNSKLIGRESFILQGTSMEEPEQIMTGFVKQFYGSAPYLPPLLLLQHPVEDREIIENWLQGKRGSKVTIQVPNRGNKKKLVDIVAKNAEQGLQQLKIKQQAGASALTEALEEIKRELHLPDSPSRMECYDISNIQGRISVGSMVVFEKGKPKSSHYRRFKIKTVSGTDDYAMLQEVLRRRFRRVNQPEKESTGSWAILPDLVLIDGGKGQLSSAVEAMEETGAGSIPVASLAKENEEVFLPRQSKPILLPGSSPGLQMLQRLRDEAHRFAISYHRNTRRKSSFSSALDDIPGIGPKRKKALLKHFGSLRAIREASPEELIAAEGISSSQAQLIKEHL